MPFSISRYRLVKYLIPLFSVFYLFMVWLRPVIGVTQDEIFPFFSWQLFSNTPGWERTENAVIVHSIDGTPVAGTRYLIPNNSISDMKNLRRSISSCSRPEDCDRAVKQYLYPVVRRLTRANEVEFSIVKVRIDLRDVRRDIASLVRGEAKRTDFYRPHRVLGHWTTIGGAIWVDNSEFAEPGDDWWKTIEVQLSESEPVISSDYDVYLSGNRLIYVKYSCKHPDTYARFFLHVFPIDKNDLPDQRKQFGFDNLDFSFGAYRHKGGEKCMVARELPGYDIARIRTGQYISGKGRIWEGSFKLAGPGDDR